MSSEFDRYARDEFLGRFFSGVEDKAEIAAEIEQRLAEMRRRLGITQAQVAGRVGIPRAASPPSSTLSPALPNCAP